ncbi:MAG: DUF2939 domain-containing protein [Caulobacteraceae bacterium]|nr:DUF2939 domain-containing protein [Caulobacteraceae bacterium]
MKFRVALAALMALVVSACAEAERYDAAGDIHALLVSIRDGDREAFDAHVDRRALKNQLRARLMAEATRRSGGDPTVAALGALLGRSLVDAAADALIQPDVFRAVADYLGYSADRPIPGPIVIAQALRRIDDDHVCVTRRKDGPCVLTFEDEDHVWRLTGFDGDVGMLRTPKGG